MDLVSGDSGHPVCRRIFMVVDRWRHKPARETADETLMQRRERSLAQVEHQIWLLRNVLWWYIVPLSVVCAVFDSRRLEHTSQRLEWDIVAVQTAILFLIVDVFVYWLNQRAVRRTWSRGGENWKSCWRAFGTNLEPIRLSRRRRLDPAPRQRNAREKPGQWQLRTLLLPRQKL